MRRTLILGAIGVLLGLGMVTASAMPPNPFTGRWESIDPVDRSFQAVQIAPNGHFNLRDTVGTVCDLSAAAQFTGRGSFDLSANTFTATGDVYCLFADDRVQVLSGTTVVFTLLADGTMVDDLGPGGSIGATWFHVPPGLP